MLFNEGLMASTPVAEHVMKLRNRMISRSNQTFAQIIGDPSEAGAPSGRTTDLCTVRGWRIDRPLVARPSGNAHGNAAPADARAC